MNGFRTQLTVAALRGSGRGIQRVPVSTQFRAFSYTRRPLLWLAGHNSTTSPGNSAALARRGRLEAVLFLAREPLALRKLAQLANLADATEARTLVKG